MSYHPGVGDFVYGAPENSSLNSPAINSSGIRAQPTLSTVTVVAVPIVLAGAVVSPHGRKLNVTVRRILRSNASGVARGFTKIPLTPSTSFSVSLTQTMKSGLGSSSVSSSQTTDVRTETSQAASPKENFSLSTAERLGASMRRAVGQAKPFTFMRTPIDIDQRSPGSILANVRHKALKELERSGAEQLPADFYQHIMIEHGGSTYINGLIVQECKNAEAIIRAFRIEQLATVTATFRRAAGRFPHATTVLMGALLIGLSIYESFNQDKGTLQIAKKMINKEIEANKKQAEVDLIAFKKEVEAEKVALRDAFERLNRQVEKLPPELQAGIKASIDQLQAEMSAYQAKGEVIISQRLEELRALEPIANEEATIPKREIGAAGAALSSLVLGLNLGNTKIIAAVFKYLIQAGIPQKMAKDIVIGTLQITVEEMLRSVTAETVTKEQVNHYCLPILKRLGIDPNETHTPAEEKFSQELMSVISKMMAKMGAAYVSHAVGTAGVSAATEAVTSETTQQLSQAGLHAVTSRTPYVESHLTSQEVEKNVQEFLQPIKRRISEFRREYIESYGAKVEARLARIQAVEELVQVKLREIAAEQSAPASDPLANVSAKTSEAAASVLASASISR